jgi:hypothetical protein
VPEIYVIMAIPLKCVAVHFRMSPEGNTTLSAVFTIRGQPEEYGHALEVDDHKEVDFRH